MHTPRSNSAQWVRNAERSMEETIIRSIAGVIFVIAAAGAAVVWPEYAAAAIGLAVAWKTTAALNKKPANRGRAKDWQNK